MRDLNKELLAADIYIHIKDCCPSLDKSFIKAPKAEVSLRATFARSIYT